MMHETPLAEGRLSIASVAVDYARRIFDHFNDKVVLNIGAGKMATLVLRHFADLSPKKLIVCNRDATKAVALAERFGGQAAAFEQLDRIKVPVFSIGIWAKVELHLQGNIGNHRRRQQCVGFGKFHRATHGLTTELSNASAVRVICAQPPSLECLFDLSQQLISISL